MHPKQTPAVLPTHYPALPATLKMQVLDWIKDPVSAKDYARQRKNKGCGKPTDMWFPSGKFCKSVSCVNGEPGGVAQDQCAACLQPACMLPLEATMHSKCVAPFSTIRQATGLMWPAPAHAWLSSLTTSRVST